MSRSDHNEAHVGLSLAVLCWNHAEFVEQCLDSVRTGSLQDPEVIMVDNGSGDGSPEVIRAFIQGHDPSWTLIENKSNLGICPALNQALLTPKASTSR